MCGIVGFYARRDANAGLVERMAATIRHRGPDHTGILKDDSFCFAMNRLSIIDLAGGNQPMHSPDGAVSLIFNGEIYNYRELKSELAPKISFNTNSDTEVILNGYLLMGEEIFARLNGIFSVAVWHHGSRELLIARDPVGVKPLYYLVNDSGLYFSSEIKSFTATGIANQANLPAIIQFLCSGYVFHPDTAINGVKQLKPGCLMRVGPAMEVNLRQFRRLPMFRPPAQRRSATAWHEMAHEVVAAAVVRQTVSDVSYGLLLSSGVDSMTILAALHERCLDERLRTYTVTYDSDSFAEHEPVERLAREWGFSNERVTLTGDRVKQRLPDLFWTFDNLELLPTCAAIHEVSHLAGASNRVLLSGNGGDELFLGYPTYPATKIVAQFPAIGVLAKRLQFLARLMPVTDDYLSINEKIHRFLVAADADPVASHLKWRHVFTPDDLRPLFVEQFSVEIDQVFSPQTKLFKEGSEEGYSGLAKYSYGDLRTWMVDCGLMMWDKAGMSASTEIRVPLVDLDLLDFVLAMPIEIRGARPGSKSFLRALFKNYLPPYITNLPKKGFQAPIATWLRGVLNPAFRELTDALPAKLIGKSVVEQLWRDFEDHKRDNALKIWILGSLAGWASSHKVNLGY
jgi:asparagine synthase (glutamine-hydrolysing)